MIYLNKEDLEQIGINWEETLEVIEKSIRCLGTEDFVQPLKPYLRFKDLKNRIIAMPAYLGGDFDKAGIKWIAGFPDNIYKSLPRANSMTILNNADNGLPEAIICSSLLSIIRTVAVSGLMIRGYLRSRNSGKLNIGVLGRGPIGKYHIRMCEELFGENILNIYSNSLRPIDEETLEISSKVVDVSSSAELVAKSDIIITCTVPSENYLEEKPTEGALILNVSLRDFGARIYESVKNAIIVDAWENVCRGGTDIEKMHLEYGLQRENVKTLFDVIENKCMDEYHPNDTIMVNSMGMGIFDISIATYYYNKALEQSIGQKLEYK